MFCRNCGKEMKDDALFCANCGTRVQEMLPKSAALSTPEPTSKVVADKVTEPVTEPVSNDKKTILIAGIALIAILCVAGIAAFLLFGSKKKFDLTPYVAQSTSGYDGYGEVEVYFDWDAFLEENGGNIAYTSAGKKQFGEKKQASEAIQKYVKVVADETENLSNGDEVAYHFKINTESVEKYFKCNLSYEDGSITVDGLEEIDKFDAFTDLEVEYRGIAPHGYVAIYYYGDEFTEDDFYIDGEKSLSHTVANGDEIVISIDEDVALAYAKKNGKMPESLEKTYTVEGLAYYIQTIDDIDDAYFADFLETAEYIYEEESISNFADSETLEEMNYLGYYMLTDNGDGEAIYDNVLYLVYEVKVRDVKESEKYDEVNTTYWYMAYEDIMCDADGYTDSFYPDWDPLSNVVYFYVDDDDHGRGGWYYYGYKSLEELYEEEIAELEGDYNIEENLESGYESEENQENTDKDSDAEDVHGQIKETKFES